MPRRRADPDPELVWAILDPAEREVVAGWVESLGLDCWTACPPLATLVPLVAALRLATDMGDLSVSDRLAEAAEILGMPDDSSLRTRPSDRWARLLRRWNERGGQNDRTPKEDVA